MHDFEIGITLLGNSIHEQSSPRLLSFLLFNKGTGTLGLSIRPAEAGASRIELAIDCSETTMTIAKAAAKSAAFSFPYITCRNISAPEDDDAGRKIYSGHAKASSVLALEDNENVREYLVDAQGKQKRMPTLVHQAIRKTLTDNPDQFSVLNGGMVIVAHGAEIDDKNRIMVLKRPSIINGSQTQGELQRYFKRRSPDDEFEPSIKFEVIVTNDNDLIAEISIARNFQNDVRAISIAGRRGQLDELEESLQRVDSRVRLRKSESDVVAEGEFVDTEKLIQVIFALMPTPVIKEMDSDHDGSKVFAYSQKTRCLKSFTKLIERKDEDAGAQKAYRFFLDVAGDAWKLYEKWKTHPLFKGTRIRSIERDGGEIVEVPDGIIFPILGALSAFFHDSGRKWHFKMPAVFDERELIDAAASVYMEIAEHNPQTMGKSKACYSTLLRLTGVYARLLSDG